MRNLHSLAVILTMACCHQEAYAQDTQDRKKIESDLSATMEALRSATKARKELETRNTKLLAELADLQEDLVSIADQVRRQEKLLSEIDRWKPVIEKAGEYAD